MTQALAISPTSFKLFMDCPRKYKACYIEKLYKFEGNKYTERGDIVHKLMENEVKYILHENWGKPTWPDDLKTVRPFAKQAIRDLDIPYFMNAGWKITTEKEAAVDETGNTVGWWESSYLRSRIDLFMISPDYKKGIIVDWKTGKTRGNDSQLAINILTLSPKERTCEEYGVAFVYLDLKEVDFKMIENTLTAPESKEDPFFDEVIYNIKKLRTIQENNGVYERNPGATCRWCEIKGICDNEARG
jgi:hypothetical protein